MFITDKLRKFDVRRRRMAFFFRHRVFAKRTASVVVTSCKRVATEIAFGGKIRKSIGQSQFVRACRQLTNLKRKLLCHACAKVIRQRSQRANFLRDWLFLIVPNDLILPRARDRRSEQANSLRIVTEIRLRIFTSTPGGHSVA